MVHREELAVERPERLAPAVGGLHDLGRDPVLGELAGDEGEGQPGADERDVGALPEEVGDAADVVLVRVGDDDGLDEAEPAVQAGEVGQDQVNPGLIGLGKQHPAVHHEEAAPVLEHGHVAADLTEAAETDQSQAVTGQWRRQAQFRMRMAHSLSPALSAVMLSLGA